MFDYASYAKSLREEIHQYPELGFDLPKTLAVVHRELDAIGLTYTDKYCESSVVSVINPGKDFTIALRADMDALPIQEEVDVPYKSKIDGQMHACGHDFHTATLIAVAKYLVDHQDQLNCTVKLIFSPAEECSTACNTIVQNGALEGVDCAITLHVASLVDEGCIMVNEPGGLNGNTRSFNIDVYGKSCHAAAQHNGKDAILAAAQVIQAIEFMLAKEIDGRKCKVVNIGSIHGGNVANVLCDHVQMKGTIRTWDDDVHEEITRRIEEICQGISLATGTKCQMTVLKSMPYNRMDPKIYERLYAAAAKAVGKENVVQRPRTLGGEDFAFISRAVPAGQFKVGIRPLDATEKIVGHSGKFHISTDRSYQTAIDTFVNFVFDNMNGIDFA